MQLEAVGLTIEPHNGQLGMDIVFNDGLFRFAIRRASGLTITLEVWANNGDAISRA